MAHALYGMMTKFLPSLSSGNIFLSEVTNMETRTAIEVNNDTYCLQYRKEMFLLARIEILSGISAFYQACFTVELNNFCKCFANLAIWRTSE